MIIQNVILHSWFQANPEYPFCTGIKKGDNHLKHNSLICTVPWQPFLAPTQSHFSLTYLLQATTLGLSTPKTVTLLGHAPPRLAPFRLAQTILSQAFSCINNPTISSPLFFLFILLMVFRNVDKWNSDAGESPKRKNRVILTCLSVICLTTCEILYSVS